MFDMHRVELDWGGRKLVLETGRVARQADGAVLATYGETTVLATVVAAKQPKEGIDFLPLTVNYTGKILRGGPYSRRLFQARRRGPTEKETLASRLIDRPIRPLFADGWRCETQVIVTVLSHDLENDPDIVAHGRGLGGAHAVGRAVHGPDRRRPRRLHQQRIRAQSAARRDGREPARPGRGRHHRRGADGGIGSQGAVRGNHARRGDVRPPAFPAGDRRHHQARRKSGEGAARARSPVDKPRWKRKSSASPRRTCARPIRSPPSRSGRTPSPPSRPR